MTSNLFDKTISVLTSAIGQLASLRCSYQPSQVGYQETTQEIRRLEDLRSELWHSGVKTVEKAAAESSCQKRSTVVQIFDAADNLLACESNRCAPAGGTCHRLGVVQGKENYDTHSHCNWTHAEIMALKAVPSWGKPYRARLYGHSFYCDACEAALRSRGVEILDIEKL